MMQSVVAGLPYLLAKDRVKDLVIYAVSMSNFKASTGIELNVCLCVRFIGYEPDFKTELGLAFGDYIKAYDPESKDKSNNGMPARTEPCVALNPSANRNGSWVMYNLAMKAYVRWLQWKKLLVNQFVIDAMKAMAPNSLVNLLGSR